MYIAPDLFEQIPVMSLRAALEEEIVASALVRLTLGTHVRVELLGLLARDPNTVRVKPILTAVAADVEPNTKI